MALARTGPFGVDCAVFGWGRAPIRPASVVELARPPAAAGLSEQIHRPTSTVGPRLNPHSAQPHLQPFSSRDFVPWRFSDASRPCAWMDHPAGVRETCTGGDERLQTLLQRISMSNGGYVVPVPFALHFEVCAPQSEFFGESDSCMWVRYELEIIPQLLRLISDIDTRH